MGEHETSRAPFDASRPNIARIYDYLLGGNDAPPMSVRVLRQMRKTGADEPWFGEDFLWALLATKAPSDGLSVTG